MNYRNAQDIFPEQLLKQIQRYVSGETIYIPASEQKKKAWGESSCYRAYLAKSNHAIRDDFAGAFIFYSFLFLISIISILVETRL